MSEYLRDESLRNLNMSKSALDELNSSLIKIRDGENVKIGNNSSSQQFITMTYIIRFDQKGFKLYEYNKAMEYFNSAKEIERFIFQLDSDEHSKTYKLKGKGVEIKFDSKVPGNCSLTVQDSQQGWVDSTFLTLQEVIKKYNNGNKLMRSTFVVLSIQVLGVLIGILFSLWVASKVSHRLSTPYPYGLTFIITLLIYSNIWGYLYLVLLKCVNAFWPNISFKEMTGLRKFMKDSAFALFITGFIAIISSIGCSLYGFIKSLIK